jgi:AbrB family looped-hinge helix DNA binding protein
MRTTIDRAGRVVVPRAIRERLQLLGGGQVEIIERAGVIEIVPVPAEVEIVDTDEGPVAMPLGSLPALTDAEVLAAIDESRR